MNKTQKRKNPNHSYMRFVRVMRQAETSRTEEDQAFVNTVMAEWDDLHACLPGLCREGRPDALLLQYERCRYESVKGQYAQLADGGVIVSSDLSAALRSAIKARVSRSKRKHRLDDEVAARLLETLEPSVIRGRVYGEVILTKPNAVCLRDYLTGWWFEGLRGVTGRHATTDRKVAELFLHCSRYSIVEDLREAGRTVMDALEEAPDYSEKGVRLGTSHAFQKSHKLVTKLIREDPQAPFLVMMLAWFLQANDELGLWDRTG